MCSSFTSSEGTADSGNFIFAGLSVTFLFALPLLFFAAGSVAFVIDTDTAVFNAILDDYFSFLLHVLLSLLFVLIVLFFSSIYICFAVLSSRLT